MKILLYNELDPSKIPGFKKMKSFLETDDFRSAEIKKVGANLYRAKLDKTNRLLFSIHRYRGESHALILEWIKFHAYEKSRFLNASTVIDENKIPKVHSINDVQQESLVYLNPHTSKFNLLDKIISFDEIQHSIYEVQPPLIIIGSAGSGKTALTLEKMKESVGDILYVTRSPYLVQNSRNLYYAHNYINEDQQLDFLSFEEFLQSILVPEGREISLREFTQWFNRHRTASGVKDAHQLYEEFKGVLTGAVTHVPYLSQEAYFQLGIKQSIFNQAEREQVYELFKKYLAYLSKHGYYDANILSYEYMKVSEPRYDFVVVDEVQDLTNVQLQLILKSLRQHSDFILCGDSNQIVHPNFFSWSKVKTFFYKQKEQENRTAPADLIRILTTNYRNSPQVTEIANRVLKIKNARFGSIDRESNYLVKSNAHDSGKVVLLPDSGVIKRELEQKTHQSTRFAIIVMHPEQKTSVKKDFSTPLVFAIQEAKGLEYDNVILYNFVSPDEKRFRQITHGVSHEHLQEELSYARAKDKRDKSLEIYKFHINALYVAITRAIKNIYLIEANPKQRLFDLLQIRPLETSLTLEDQSSNLDDWRREARKLELQGKQEQADEIRSQILKQKSVPWQILKDATLEALQHKAISEGNKKAKLALFEYGLVYRDQSRLNELLKVGYAPAKNPDKGLNQLNRKYYLPYELKHTTAVIRQVNQYGVDFRNQFNQTPLMIASRLGNVPLVEQLIESGADTKLVNNVGFNAFQIALEQACADKKYAAKKLAAVYQRLEPDSMTIQVDDRLIKLDNHLMEFLMLNLMMAMFYIRLGQNVFRGGAFSSGDFYQVLADFPARVVPERRKKRPYISSILSKNEINRDDKYNRKLFYRIKRGHYIVNPKLSVRIDGNWHNIYELLSLEMIDYAHIDPSEFRYSSIDVNEFIQQNLAQFRSYVRGLIEK